MTRRCSKYIRRRGVNFQLRLPIPKDLHQALARKELRWSLHTSVPEIAEKIALKARLAFLDLCCNIRLMGSYTKADIQKLVQEFYKRLIAEAIHKPFTERLVPPHDQVAYQEEDEKYIEGRRLEADLNNYPTATKENAAAELKQNGLLPKELSPTKFLALCNGITRLRTH